MIFLDSCSSTQTIAKNLIDDGFSGDFEYIISKKMTSGKTSKPDVKWYSPEGNLYLSLITRKNNVDYFQIPPLVVYSILKFIQNEFGANNPSSIIKIKWPNDILINNKKVCGVLSEFYKDYYIIGIGINLLLYPDQTLNFPATSIKESFDIKSFDILDIGEKLSTTFLSNFGLLVDKQLKTSFIFDFLEKNFYQINDKIIIKGDSTEYTGKFIGISEGYEMLVEEGGVIKKYGVGEVSYT